MAKEGLEAKAEEALMKLMEELEEKRDAFMKVKEDVEAKKEAFMKVMEVAEASKRDALMMVKGGVEAKTEEALMKVLGEVENKKEAFMKVKEDVEEKIEPVKTFILGALAASNYKTKIIPTFSTTINTAVAATVAAIEYHSDSSDSSKESAESLNHEKVGARSRKPHPTMRDGTSYAGNKDFKGFSSSTQNIQVQNGTYAYLEKGSSSGHGIGNLVNKTAEGATEIDLEKLYQKQESHKFYCPNCNTCITKVLIKPPEEDIFRCTNCFAFLIPGGNWLCNMFGSRKPDDGSVRIDMPTYEPLVRAEPRSSKPWQILKSIVYGGLAESITSLGIVTSAASADAATLNIMALALANLIGGLFTIIHNLWEFKNDDSTVRSEETGEQVNRYQEILGRKENFILHATAAILSFLIFGLVPPVVYGFSFRDTDDKDLKIAAVAGASLICITLLALAKARTRRNPNYIQTVAQYVSVGFGVSGASYVAGDSLDRLLEQLGWFQQTHGDKTFPLPQFMSAWLVPADAWR